MMIPPAVQQPYTPAKKTKPISVFLQEAGLRKNDHYQAAAAAHLVDASPLDFVMLAPVRTAYSFYQAANGERVSDGALANLDDTLKHCGGLSIATLATLGLMNRVMGVGEFLGFASWFGAMAITPRIINAMVQLKTGLNLNRKFHSTNEEYHSVYKDPQYMPLQLLPDQEIRHIAQKVGIPLNHPNYREMTEARIKQIAAQSETWWMLVAGPATPVLSGLICDHLNQPVIEGLSHLKSLYYQKRAQSSEAALGQYAQKLVDQQIGKTPDSLLSQWWVQFNRKMVHGLGINANIYETALKGNQQETLKELVKHFASLSKEANHFQLKDLERLIRDEQKLLDGIQKNTLKTLKGLKVPAPEMTRFTEAIEARYSNALSTLNHYTVLLQHLRLGNISSKNISILMESANLPEVQKLIVNGSYAQAKKLVGNNEAIFNLLQKQIEMRQYGPAFELMGASPAQHLLKALHEVSHHKLWRSRMIYGLGGGLLLATVLFTSLFVGNNPEKHRGGIA